jgi:predicted RNase H-like nuclease (RuvC/YqgF family)
MGPIRVVHDRGGEGSIRPMAENGEIAELRRELHLLREAHEARGRLLARQRWEFADRLRDETAGRDAEIERLRTEVERLGREVEGKQRELETLLNTRTFRYTSALRGLWGMVRRRG